METFKITDIICWEEDIEKMEMDASLMGWEKVNEMAAEERAEKNREWIKGLPFECEAESLEDAIAQYNEKFCKGHYLKVEDVEIYDEEDAEDREKYYDLSDDIDNRFAFQP